MSKGLQNPRKRILYKLFALIQRMQLILLTMIGSFMALSQEALALKQRMQPFDLGDALTGNCQICQIK